jgi:hypothetical protein
MRVVVFDFVAVLEHNLVNSNAGVLVFVVSQQLKKLKSLI